MNVKCITTPNFICGLIPKPNPCILWLVHWTPWCSCDAWRVFARHPLQLSAGLLVSPGECQDSSLTLVRKTAKQQTYCVTQKNKPVYFDYFFQYTSGDQNFLQITGADFINTHIIITSPDLLLNDANAKNSWCSSCKAGFRDSARQKDESFSISVSVGPNVKFKLRDLRSSHRCCWRCK